MTELGKQFDEKAHGQVRQVLSSEQMIRLYQVRLQVRGAVYGVNNQWIANRLKFTDEQKKKAAELEKKLRKSEFTLEDFRDQMVQIRKMGSFSDIIGMIPGMSTNKHFKNLEVDEKEFIKIEAIINSMTPQERRQHALIKGSRRKRIAKGSGTSVQDINKLLKNYSQVLKMIKKINKGGMRGLGRGMLPF